MTPHSRRVAAVRALPWALSLWLVAGAPAAGAADTSAAQQLQHWSAQAGRPGDAAAGRVFFTSRHGGEWSCASCHGNPPTANGRHEGTGKTIAPLAPAFNPKSFTDTAKVDKWFRRNCRDVLERECSAKEKADVMAFLQGLKP
ncbi:DUF1924 domain-containing protein [Ramlibacter sp.]|uniref:DUF1924 domain-containing protein n=1 Tax=Ramlibacter sp. TaxID=1917967 RepID=UPI002FCC8029